MTSHPNFDRTQAALNAARQGDYAPAFDAFTDDVLMENGPGAGHWHRARGEGRPGAAAARVCALAGRDLPPRRPVRLCRRPRGYLADPRDRYRPERRPLDNLAVYISRLRPDGQTERLWTVDLDAEHCEAFWAKNPGTPSKDFS
jgi:hypothetical protein